jgi:hypothetical protein
VQNLSYSTKTNPVQIALASIIQELIFVFKWKIRITLLINTHLACSVMKILTEFECMHGTDEKEECTDRYSLIICR